MYSGIALLFYTEDDFYELCKAIAVNGSSFYNDDSFYRLRDMLPVKSEFFGMENYSIEFTDLNDKKHTFMEAFAVHAKKQPFLSDTAYSSKEELIQEFRNTVMSDSILKTAVPENFDFESHIGTYTAVYHK